MKTRPSKTKCFIWIFIPVTHSIIYHYEKEKTEFFAMQKSLRVLKLLKVLLGVLFRFHSDRALFRFLSDRVLLRVLSDRIFFESSVISSSSGSSVIDSSLGSSVLGHLFFWHPLFFIKTCYSFFIKNMFCFTLYF